MTIIVIIMIMIIGSGFAGRYVGKRPLWSAWRPAKPSPAALILYCIVLLYYIALYHIYIYIEREREIEREI